MPAEKPGLENQPAPEPLFQPGVGAEGEGSWIPKAVGFGIAALAVTVGILVWREVRGPEPQGPPTYASQLKISDLKLSQAQNFVGGTVTYLEGNIANTGDKTVTSVGVSVTFRNSLDEIVQKETLPVRILDRGGPYPDTLDLRQRPLNPGQQREFRLTFEHLSSDWNQQSPEISVVAASLQ